MSRNSWLSDPNRNTPTVPVDPVARHLDAEPLLDLLAGGGSSCARRRDPSTRQSIAQGLNRSTWFTEIVRSDANVHRAATVLEDLLDARPHRDDVAVEIAPLALGEVAVHAGLQPDAGLVVVEVLRRGDVDDGVDALDVDRAHVAGRVGDHPDLELGEGSQVLDRGSQGVEVHLRAAHHEHPSAPAAGGRRAAAPGPGRSSDRASLGGTSDVASGLALVGQAVDARPAALGGPCGGTRPRRCRTARR